jgi:hypothetical protein
MSPPDPAEPRLRKGQVPAVADAVEQPLVHRRHQLAVLPQQALGPQQQDGVVEAAGAAGLALVHPDHAVDVVLRAGGGELVDVGAGDVDRALPEPRPHLVETVEAGGFVRPRARRIERDERLREDRELDPVARRVAEQPHGLVDGRLRVQDHRGRLDGGDADLVGGHRATLAAALDRVKPPPSSALPRAPGRRLTSADGGSPG